MGRTLDGRVLVGAGLVAAVMVVNGTLAYRNTHQLSEDARWVAHTQEVRGEIGGVLRALADAETGYRGFALTGKDEFLEPYNAAVATLPDHLARLKTLTGDNPGQQERVGR